MQYSLSVETVLHSSLNNIQRNASLPSLSKVPETNNSGSSSTATICSESQTLNNVAEQEGELKDIVGSLPNTKKHAFGTLPRLHLNKVKGSRKSCCENNPPNYDNNNHRSGTVSLDRREAKVITRRISTGNIEMSDYNADDLHNQNGAVATTPGSIRSFLHLPKFSEPLVDFYNSTPRSVTLSRVEATRFKKYSSSVDNVSSNVFSKRGGSKGSKKSLNSSSCNHFMLSFNPETAGDLEQVVVYDGESVRKAILLTFEERGLNIDDFHLYVRDQSHTNPISQASDASLLCGKLVDVCKKKTDEKLPQASLSSSFSSKVTSKESRKSEKRNSTSGDNLEKLKIVLENIGNSLRMGRNNTDDFVSHLAYNNNNSNSNSITISCSSPSPTTLSPLKTSASFSASPTLPASSGNDLEFQLEEDWQHIVKNSQKLTRQQQQHQSAIWELLSTEMKYIKNLKSVVNIHIAQLECLQEQHNLLTSINCKQLFSNFDQIYKANTELWNVYLTKILETSKRTGSPFDSCLMSDGFLKLPMIFKPYINFCKETNGCKKYLQEEKESNNCFAAFLQWADKQILNEENKEGLKDQLSKPFQRLMRYKMLLERIRDETSVDKERQQLDQMASVVASFVQEVNDNIAVEQQKLVLHEIQSRLECYDVLDYCAITEEYQRVIEEYCNISIIAPMTHNHRYRDLLDEVTLKIKEGPGKWTEINCLLFTDILLLTKGNGKMKNHYDHFKVFKSPIFLDKIVLRKLHESPLTIALIVLNDLNVLSAFYVISGDFKKLRQFCDKLRLAMTAYKDQKMPQQPTITNSTSNTLQNISISNSTSNDLEIKVIPATPHAIRITQSQSLPESNNLILPKSTVTKSQSTNSASNSTSTTATAVPTVSDRRIKRQSQSVSNNNDNAVLTTSGSLDSSSGILQRGVVLTGNLNSPNREATIKEQFGNDLQPNCNGIPGNSSPFASSEDCYFDNDDVYTCFNQDNFSSNDELQQQLPLSEVSGSKRLRTDRRYQTTDYITQSPKCGNNVSPFLLQKRQSWNCGALANSSNNNTHSVHTHMSLQHDYSTRTMTTNSIESMQNSSGFSSLSSVPQSITELHEPANSVLTSFYLHRDDNLRRTLSYKAGKSGKIFDKFCSLPPNEILNDNSNFDDDQLNLNNSPSTSHIIAKESMPIKLGPCERLIQSHSFLKRSLLTRSLTDLVFDPMSDEHDIKSTSSMSPSLSQHVDDNFSFGKVSKFQKAVGKQQRNSNTDFTVRSATLKKSSVDNIVKEFLLLQTTEDAATRV